MGLFEKARHLADAQLRALLEPGAAVPEEVVRRAILDLDGYRRELSSQIATHANEEAFLGRQIAERSTALARWRARQTLATERSRPDLARTATQRAERVQAECEALESRRELLSAAIANLNAGLEKVERTLRFVREKKRRLEATRLGTAAPAGPPDAAAADGALAGSFAPAEPDDPIEAEFRRLEHEEVTRHLDRLRAPPPEGEGPSA